MISARSLWPVYDVACRRLGGFTHAASPSTSVAICDDFGHHSHRIAAALASVWQKCIRPLCVKERPLPGLVMVSDIRIERKPLRMRMSARVAGGLHGVLRPSLSAPRDKAGLRQRWTRTIRWRVAGAGTPRTVACRSTAPVA